MIKYKLIGCRTGRFSFRGPNLSSKLMCGAKDDSQKFWVESDFTVADVEKILNNLVYVEKTRRSVS